MAIKKCTNGHHYDADYFPSCPHCGIKTVNINADEPTIIVTPRCTVPTPGKDSVTVLEHPCITDEKTIVLRESQKFDPVVAWLVCVDGTDRGNQEIVCAGQNFFGYSLARSAFANASDKANSKTHGSLIYDSKHNQFFLVPGKDSPLIYNGKLLKDHVQLGDFAKIKLRDQEYVFVALCRKEFTW